MIISRFPIDQMGAEAVPVPIYGAEWDGSSTTVWSRTDDAALFPDPEAYYSGCTTYGSPFDSIMPWAGMTIVEDAEAGTLVQIPKFWYKWTLNGKALKLQISPQRVGGFYVSPAHADRGDGKGERDVVYIGRYHCGDDYKSATGQTPKVYITRATARTAIHNLGNTVWQIDLAIRQTIWMLYLVEYANWDSQEIIGYGGGNGTSVEAVGASDGMPYHTGTPYLSRSSYGVGVQYRNIEGLWDDCYDWIDGCYYNDNGLNVIANPEVFSNSEGGSLVGLPASGYPIAMSLSVVFGIQWVFPADSTSSSTGYVTDYWNFDASCPCLRGGGNFGRSEERGIFYIYCSKAAGSHSSVGSRLMKL